MTILIIKALFLDNIYISIIGCNYIIIGIESIYRVAQQQPNNSIKRYRNIENSKYERIRKAISKNITTSFITRLAI